MTPTPYRSRKRWWLALYLLALLASQAWIATRPEPADRIPEGSERVRVGPAARELGGLQWSPAKPSEGHLPVLLLHGSPGDATNFAALGRQLAESGRDVLALDLPGFGASRDAPGGRSILEHARAALEASPWPRFHVLAWSMGGGVALHMAELAPQRVATLALAASIGVQEAEGSGSFAFEHLKYALSWMLLVPGAELLPHFGLQLVPGAELLPHFGLLGERSERRAFCLNFWQSDQRPLRALMAKLGTPTLIVHGDQDFLVPLWCAEQSHELLQQSRLVVLEAGHFLVISPPFGQLDRLLPEFETFLSRHDRAGVPEVRARIDPSPPRAQRTAAPFALQRGVPWWLLGLACAWLACASPTASGVVVGGLAASLQLDLGLGLIGAACGVSLAALLARSPRAWGLGLLSTLLAAALGALVASSLGAGLGRWFGPWGGLVLASALPLLALLCLRRALRSWRARRPPGRTAPATPRSPAP